MPGEAIIHMISRPLAGTALLALIVPDSHAHRNRSCRNTGWEPATSTGIRRNVPISLHVS